MRIPAIDWMKRDATAYPMMYASGVSEESIHQAESLLAVSFSESYRRFLGEFGGAMVGSEPILGLARADVMGTDLWSVVETTQRFRLDGWPGTERWYVVSVDGGGNPIGIDETGQVYRSDHQGGGIQRIADCFEDFLGQLTG